MSRLLPEANHEAYLGTLQPNECFSSSDGTDDLYSKPLFQDPSVKIEDCDHGESLPEKSTVRLLRTASMQLKKQSKTMKNKKHTRLCSSSSNTSMTSADLSVGTEDRMRDSVLRKTKGSFFLATTSAPSLTTDESSDTGHRDLCQNQKQKEHNLRPGDLNKPALLNYRKEPERNLTLRKPVVLSSADSLYTHHNFSESGKVGEGDENLMTFEYADQEKLVDLDTGDADQLPLALGSSNATAVISGSMSGSLCSLNEEIYGTKKASSFNFGANLMNGANLPTTDAVSRISRDPDQNCGAVCGSLASLLPCYFADEQTQKVAENRKAPTDWSSDIDMYAMLEFVCEALRNTQSWIDEVPSSCKRRLCECDAFKSFLCAEFYKTSQILIGQEIFAFICWHILNRNGSPNEYELDDLISMFENAKVEMWALEWKKLPLSNLLQSLSQFSRSSNVTRTQNKTSCRSMITTQDIIHPSSVNNSDLKSGNLLTLVENNQHAKVTVEQQDNRLPSKPFDLVKSSSEAPHALSIKKLSGALSNTQLRRLRSKAPSFSSSATYPDDDPFDKERLDRKPTADKIDFALQANQHWGSSTSLASCSSLHPVEPTSNESQERILDACNILHKTSKRNIWRMIDFALTDFFLQSPELTCCIVGPNGPLLVHEILFGAKCKTWANVRWSYGKWAGRYLVIDLRQGVVPATGLWTVLEYIYAGNFTITVDNAFESQKAAEFFGIPIITDACLRLFNCLTSRKMVCYTLESLRQQQKQNHPLWTLALGKLVVCFDECYNERVMIKWPLDLMVTIFEQPELRTKFSLLQIRERARTLHAAIIEMSEIHMYRWLQDEVLLYNLAIRWVEADFARRHSLIPQIMNPIRFISMSADALLFISSHAKVLVGHPALQQEIADVHLKVRMETSGFDIPPEMDWGIPRRSRRTPVAAQAYAQSDRDLNVLMLYFCPRDPPPSSLRNSAELDEAVSLFKRYLAVSTKFVLIDRRGRFAGHWIYWGTPQPGRREQIQRLKRIKKTHRLSNRTVDNDAEEGTCDEDFDMSTEPIEDLGNQESDRESTDLEDVRRPLARGRQSNRKSAKRGTVFKDILKYLHRIEPEVTTAGEMENVFDATEEGNWLVTNLFGREKKVTPVLTSHQSTTYREGHLHRMPQNQNTNFTMPNEPIRANEEQPRDKTVLQREKDVLVLSENLQSTTTWQTDLDEKATYEGKRWYVDLADKMNLLVESNRIGMLDLNVGI